MTHILYRLIALLCAALLIVCTGVAETFTLAGYDPSHSWADNGFFARMEARTGISMILRETSDQKAYTEKKAGYLEGKALPDALFKAALTPNDQQLLYRAGRLVNLAPLLPEHAPHLWEILQQNPDVLREITLPGGEIVALPMIQEAPSQDALWINRAWLDALHLDMPTDPESLEKVMKAFKEKDPNGNGRADEVPLTFLGPWELKLFSSMYGIAVDDYNLYLDESGTLHFWPEEESFEELLTWLKHLWDEELLDQSGFTTADTLRMITDSKAASPYGMFFSPTPMNLLPYESAEHFEVVTPFAAEGRRVWRSVNSGVRSGAFAITTACPSPETLLRWVDVLYTEEGAIEAIAGYVEEDYYFDEEGFWTWDSALTSGTYTNPLSDLTLYDSGAMPLAFPTDFYNHYSDSGIRHINSELRKLQSCAVVPFAHRMLTPEERDTALMYQEKLGLYVDTFIGSVITGETPLNAETMTAFRTDLKSMGADEMLAFWQSVADR